MHIYHCGGVNNINTCIICCLEKPKSAAAVTDVKKVGDEHIISLSAAGSQGCASYEWKCIT